MRAADMGVAQAILANLSKIDTERKALAGGIASAGIRCQGSSATWVAAAAQDFAAIERIVRARLDASEAHYRRRAAQIGLVLETKA